MCFRRTSSNSVDAGSAMPRCLCRWRGARLARIAISMYQSILIRSSPLDFSNTSESSSTARDCWVARRHTKTLRGFGGAGVAGNRQRLSRRCIPRRSSLRSRTRIKERASETGGVHKLLGIIHPDVSKILIGDLRQFCRGAKWRPNICGPDNETFGSPERILKPVSRDSRNVAHEAVWEWPEPTSRNGTWGPAFQIWSTLVPSADNLAPSTAPG